MPIEIIFDDGPLKGQTKQVKAGTWRVLEFWPELSPFAPMPITEPTVMPEMFVYLRIGKLVQGRPVFRCGTVHSKGAL
jgi:hypothetical protein